MPGLTELVTTGATWCSKVLYSIVGTDSQRSICANEQMVDFYPRDDISRSIGDCELQLVQVSKGIQKFQDTILGSMVSAPALLYEVPEATR